MKRNLDVARTILLVGNLVLIGSIVFWHNVVSIAASAACISLAIVVLTRAWRVRT